MGGCRCSYKDCPNTTRSSESINFFHFPVKNRQRCMKWIENCEKTSYYDLEEEQLKNKVVCHMHFESSCFANYQNKRLAAGAIPTLDKPEEVRSLNNKPLSEVKMAQAIKSGCGFKSDQYKDVQVLPVNNDKTVFFLDAENMFTESNKIESYVIRNGMLVPSSTKQRPVPKQSRTKANASTLQCHQNQFKTDPEEPTNEPPVKTIKREYVKKEVPIKKELADTVVDTVPSHPIVPDPIEADYKDNVSIEVHHPPETNQDLKSTSHLDKSYLKKIKQHSKEIATIKRLLAEKMVPEKPDLNAALSVLNEKLPATIMTVINLILGLKNDLSQEDVEFFTTLHRTSSDAYQVLSEKYGWNLPSVDVVETDD